MTPNFFEKPILNSPYETPRLHHALDLDGQPTDAPPVQGRRRSELITPVPKPRKKKNKPEQGKLALGDKEGFSSAEQEYNPTPIINEIRSHVGSWRDLPNAADWGGHASDRASVGSLAKPEFRECAAILLSGRSR